MIKLPQNFQSLPANWLPKLTVTVIATIWLFTFLSVAKWKKKEVIQQDIISYYSYLPAAIIYQDLTFRFDKEVARDKEIRIWTHQAPNGGRVQKMTMGLSFFYLPSFLVAHIYASLFDNPSGYSWPYEFMISFGALVFATLGLIYLSRVLLRYFSPVITSVSVMAIALGTNLFYYVVAEGCMSHVYSFFLFAAFMHYFLIWNESPSGKSSAVLGLIFGLICLVRPSNALIILIPALYGVKSLSSLQARLSFMWHSRKHILMAAIIFAFVISPQLIYWKWITGSWVYYSYSNESFFFSNPHIFEGLFGYRKGWLLYTPIMTLSLVGLFLLKSRLSDHLLPIIIFLTVNFFVVFSWWCWWYGGSFGARVLIETYAILGIPLAVFFQWTYEAKKKVLTRALVTVMLGGFIFLNHFQTRQYLSSLIHWDSMNGSTYWAIFGTQTFPENYRELIQKPDYQKALLGEDEH